VAGGPGMGEKRETKGGTSWEDSSDFVFAYRANKVWVRKGSIMTEDYVKDAMLGEEVVKTEGVLLQVAKEEEAGPEIEGSLKEELMDGDEKVICMIPQDEEADTDYVWYTQGKRNLDLAI
jgi:hypothetical protein